MIEGAVSFTLAPAEDVLALDLWDDGVPLVDPAVRALQVEPRRWWLIDAADHADTIEAALGDRGALVPIGGGLMRATLTGRGWRELLTISGWFDVEHPRFAPGTVAATTIHHVPVWIAMTGTDSCEVYLASSYAPTLAELWDSAIGRDAGG